MNSQPERVELLQTALENARRVAGRLRQDEIDLAHKMPGEVQGGEVLRDATAAATRVAQSIEALCSAAASSHPDP